MADDQTNYEDEVVGNEDKDEQDQTMQLFACGCRGWTTPPSTSIDFFMVVDGGTLSWWWMEDVKLVILFLDGVLCEIFSGALEEQIQIQGFVILGCFMIFCMELKKYSMSEKKGIMSKNDWFLGDLVQKIHAILKFDSE